MKFFVWLNDQQQGPFEEEVIKEMLTKKQVANDTLICPEGNDLDWTPVKELFFQESLPESFIQPPSIEEILAEQFNDGSNLEIRLNSGSDLKIKSVRLYDEVALARVSSKKAEALKMLQGVSTGIGTWGSIEWVLAASVVIRAVESVLSTGTSSSGAKLLKEVFYEERQLRKEGVFFPASKIQLIENPIPGFWRAFAKKANVTTTFVHNGDEFVIVQIEDGSTCSIRWNAVESYYYSKSAA